MRKEYRGQVRHKTNFIYDFMHTRDLLLFACVAIGGSFDSIRAKAANQPYRGGEQLR